MTPESDEPNVVRLPLKPAGWLLPPEAQESHKEAVERWARVTTALHLIRRVLR